MTLGITHPYDRALFVRCMGAIVASALLATAIVVATDEATSTLGMRAARLAALAPAMIAVSVMAVVAHARSRGELRALEALGASPWRAAEGAMIAGAVAAGVAMLVLASPWADATSLFPAMHPTLDLRFDAQGLVARSAGIAVLADGSIELFRTGAHTAFASTQNASALPSLVPIAAIVPLWSVTPMGRVVRGASLAATAVAVVFGFHLIGAGRVDAAICCVAGAPLFAATAWARARPRG